jgi:hypothetical protein
MRLILVSLLALGSCAHRPPEAPSGATGPLVLAASHRCQAGGCVCRDPESPDDQPEESPPPLGLKRFELRFGPTIDQVGINVAGRALDWRESEGNQVRCLYVDLPVGAEVPFVYRVSANDRAQGVALDLAISEYGAKGPWWYDTARVRCGGGGVPCARGDLDAWLASIHALRNGVADACGSTKIDAPSWSAPGSDLPHPPTVAAELTLRVYRFEPRSPPGSPDCRRRHRDNE